MFDYSQMNPQKFEELAKVYLETEFPDYQWNITERSGDGNRDVFCRYTFADAEVEYWAEAKFTAGSSKASLKKGQLDPTVSHFSGIFQVSTSRGLFRRLGNQNR